MAAPKEARKDKPPGWDLMAEESKQLLYHKHLLFQIHRSKNDNRVMYMANMTKDGKINPADPVKVFWLKIEPSYIEKRRKKGIKDDRTELTFLENQAAYGISTKAINAEKTEFKITFVALKEKPGIIKIDPADGLPKYYGTVKDKKGKEHKAILQSMFVESKESWVGLPSVQYVDVKGIRCKDGVSMTDRIKK